MSDGLLQVAVVTPEGAAFEGSALSVVAPAHDGEVAFLRNHAPYVGALGYGELRITPAEGDMRRFYLGGGVVRVADNTVVVLAEEVQALEDLDAAEEKRLLQEVFSHPAVDDAGLEERELLARARRARLRLAQRDV